MKDEPGRSDSRSTEPLGRRSAGFSGLEFAGVGVQFALAIVVFTFAGLWLDKRLHTTLFVFVGVFVGAAAGFFSMYRKLMAAQHRGAPPKE